MKALSTVTLVVASLALIACGGNAPDASTTGEGSTGHGRAIAQEITASPTSSSSTGGSAPTPLDPATVCDLWCTEQAACDTTMTYGYCLPLCEAGGGFTHGSCLPCAKLWQQYLDCVGGTYADAHSCSVAAEFCAPALLAEQDCEGATGCK